MYEIEYSKKAVKFLDKLDEKTYQRVKSKLLILQKILLILYLDVKKMKNISNAYRLRIGEIRVLYKIYEDEVIIFVFGIGFGGNVYK